MWSLSNFKHLCNRIEFKKQHCWINRTLLLTPMWSLKLPVCNICFRALKSIFTKTNKQLNEIPKNLNIPCLPIYMGKIVLGGVLRIYDIISTLWLRKPKGNKFPLLNKAVSTT